MQRQSQLRLACSALTLMILASTGWGQTATPEDEALDAMRTMTAIEGRDQERIRAWVDQQIQKTSASREDETARFTAFRAAFTEQRTNRRSTPAFVEALATQTAAAAVAQLPKQNIDPWVSMSLVRVLLDFESPGVVSGLTAGLKAQAPGARALAAKGLVKHLPQISQDKTQTQTVVDALRAAGQVETNALTLRSIYEALAYQNQLDMVFGVYLELLDRRVAKRRGDLLVCDGADVAAYEFFLKVAQTGGLSAERQQEVARRVAVLLRCDGQRYQEEHLSFLEIDRIERSLWVAEELLEAFTRQAGGIRRQLEEGAHENRAGVLAAMWEWVGNPDTQQKGRLNQAPWDVPDGAP